MNDKKQDWSSLDWATTEFTVIRKVVFDGDKIVRAWAELQEEVTKDGYDPELVKAVFAGKEINENKM